MPDPTSWELDLRAAYCRQCDWHYLLPPDFSASDCPNCHQAQLAFLDDPERRLTHEFSPELYLPFTASNETLEHSIQAFAGGIWFAPDDLNVTTLKTRLQRLYFPMWLLDSSVEALWQAETGYNYEVISHRDRYDQGRGGWTSEQFTETRIRWEARLGRLRRTYHNIPAPALEEHFSLLRKLGDYPVNTARQYQPAAVSGTAVRIPNRSTTDARSEAMPVLHSAAAEECRRACQADHIRQFRWHNQHHNENWTLLLLPVFVTYYLDDDKRPQSVFIHGQTGKILAPRRASMKQARRAALIMVVIACVLFGLSLMTGLISFILPPLWVVAGLGVILAVIVGMLALTPLVMVWQINRSQAEQR